MEFEWEVRLGKFAKRVARELRADSFPFSRPGTDYWVASYDVAEAVWWIAKKGTWAYENGRVRDGWAQGDALILFEGGQLGMADFHGEVDPCGLAVGLEGIRGILDSPWAAGNAGRWTSGGDKFNPQARELFQGRWPHPKGSDGAGTSSQLKKLLTERKSQLPRHY